MDPNNDNNGNGSAMENAKNDGAGNKNMELAAAVIQLEADIKKMNVYREMREKQIEITDKETEELKKKLAHKKVIIEHKRALNKCIQDEIKLRRDNIEKEKLMCQLLFEKKHEIRKKTAELQKKFETKKVEWRSKEEQSKKRLEEFEQKWLSMPWAAEYKKLFDENKRLDEEIAFTRGLIDEKQKEIAALEDDLSNTDPQRSWNKTCIQFANDMVHSNRLRTQLAETKSKIDEAKQRRARKFARLGKALPGVPTTPVQVPVVQKTPQSVPNPRQVAANFKTPMATAGSAVPKTPQSCQPAFHVNTSSNATPSPRTISVSVAPSPRKAPAPTVIESANKRSGVPPPHQSPFKVPRPDVPSHRSPGPQKTPQASPMREPAKAFKAPAPAPVTRESAAPRIHSPLVSPRVQPPPQPRSESPVSDDFFNFGGLMAESGGSDENAGSSSMGGFQLDFGDDGGDGEDDDNGLSAAFRFNF